MVKITETVLRDGHQSLIATRMSTADMLPIVEKLDQVGFFSLEMWGGATFDVCLRYLNEDPWERLRQIRKRVKNTKLQMLLRGQNLVAYQHFPDDIVVKFIEKARDNGIDIFRVFDAVNDIRNIALAIKTAKKAGGLVEGSISYTVSPVHTIEKYIQFAIELKEAGSDIICIKDMSGIISPIAAYDLINALKKEVKLPVHLHTHCSSGMAPITYLTAAEAGVDILDTAMSPFAWGTSQPPTESIVGAFKGTPYDTNLNVELLAEIAEYFQKVKEKYKDILDPISERVDPNILVHQIPGGMISNLISQLKAQNAMDKYSQVLKETALVRKELGYPPLVTPTSQIVGTQAVYNVVLGERYKMISKEVKNYVKGLYGRSPGPIDDDIKKKIIGDEKPIQGRPADGMAPAWDKTVAEVKALRNAQTVTDEDALAYAIFPQVATEFWERQAKGITGPIAPIVTSVKSNGLAGELTVRKGTQPGRISLELNNQKHQVSVTALEGPDDEILPLLVQLNNAEYKVNVQRQKRTIQPMIAVTNGNGQAAVSQPIPAERQRSPDYSIGTPEPKKEPVIETKPVPQPTAPAAPASTSGALMDVKVPMPGKIVTVKVKSGERVKRNQTLFILEAMKMQNEIASPCDGTINTINIKIGDNVESNLSAMSINPA
ncbi:MAG: pyruvate/oxaloacetate carboxyltransferase [Planctomycetota bacterium]